MIPEPPAGFKLDVAPPPDGFVLDGGQQPAEETKEPSRILETAKKVGSAVPYMTTSAVKGLMSPILPALKAVGLDTEKTLDTAIDYWRDKTGEGFGVPNYGIGRDDEGSLEVQRLKDIPATDILGQTAEAGGFVAGPLSVASKAGGLVAGTLKSARPFYQSIAKGMVTGALVGEGDKEKTLENAALFGVFEPIAYALGKASDVPKIIKNSSAWRKATIKERGLMIQSLDDTISKNPNISEAEILKRWNNPSWRKEAIERRAVTEKKPVRAETIKPESKAADIPKPPPGFEIDRPAKQADGWTPPDLSKPPGPFMKSKDGYVKGSLYAKAHKSVYEKKLAALEKRYPDPEAEPPEIAAQKAKLKNNLEMINADIAEKYGPVRERPADASPALEATEKEATEFFEGEKIATDQAAAYQGEHENLSSPAKSIIARAKKEVSSLKRQEMKKPEAERDFLRANQIGKDIEKASVKRDPEALARLYAMADSKVRTKLEKPPEIRADAIKRNSDRLVRQEQERVRKNVEAQGFLKPREEVGGVEPVTQETIKFTEKSTIGDISKSWGDVIEKEEFLAKKNAPIIENLEKELTGLSNKKADRARKKEIKERIGELRAESEYARGAGENAFLAAQEELSDNISKRAKANGITSEDDIVNITEEVQEFLYEPRAQEAIGPDWHKKTVQEITDNVIADYKQEMESIDGASYTQSESPLLGHIAAATEAKKKAWAKVKRLRQQVKNEPLGGKSAELRADLAKAASDHKAAVATEKEAIEQYKQATAPPETKISESTTLYSGLPVGEMAKLIKNVAPKWGVKIPRKSLSLLEEHTRMPYWMAKQREQFAPIKEIMDQRREAANHIKNSYFHDLLPTWQALSKKETERVGEILWKQDEKGAMLKESGLKKLTENERAALLKTNEILDYIWFEDRVQFLQDNFPDMDPESIKAMIQESGGLKGFMPHKRQGKFSASVFKNGEIIWYEQFDDIVATLSRFGDNSVYGPKSAIIQKRLEKKFKDAVVKLNEVSNDFPEEGFFETSPQVTQELINAALSKTGDDSPDFKLALEKAVAEMFKLRGFMQHSVRRKGVPGYDKSNWQQSVVDYINSWAGYKSKMIASREISKTWPNIDWGGNYDLRNYAEKYIRDALANSTQFDRSIDKVRGFAFIKYLGGNVKSAALQVTQPWIATWPRLSLETNWPMAKLAKEMTRNASDLLATIYTRPEEGLTRRQTAMKNRISPEAMRGLTRARNNGTIARQWAEELSGQMPGEYGTLKQSASKAMTYMFGVAEQFNREVTYLTAFDIAKSKGMPFEKAAKFAEEITLDTQFEYSKFNLPPFARGGNAGKSARAAYTFRSYQHNLFSLWYNMATQHEKPKIVKMINFDGRWEKKYGKFSSGRMAVLRSIGALLFFGGLAGLPFYGPFEKFIQARTGKNIGSEIKKKTGDYAGYVMRGAPDGIGIDLSGSFSMGLPQDVGDAIGVPYSMLYEDPKNFIADLKKGDYYRAVEDFPLTPTGPVKNPMKAWRLYSIGKKTRAGNQIVNDDFVQDKLSKPDAIKQALGFRPASESEDYRKYSSRKQAIDFWNNKKTTLTTKYKNAVAYFGKSSKQAKEALRDIKKFQRERPRFIPAIDIKRVIMETTGREKPNYKKLELQEEYQ